MSIKLKTDNFSSNLDSQFRNDLIDNFKIIEKSVDDDPIKNYVDNALDKFEKKIEQEIRAIIVPEDNEK